MKSKLIKEEITKTTKTVKETIKRVNESIKIKKKKKNILPDY